MKIFFAVFFSAFLISIAGICTEKKPVQYNPKSKKFKIPAPKKPQDSKLKAGNNNFIRRTRGAEPSARNLKSGAQNNSGFIEPKAQTIPSELLKAYQKKEKQ